jgi:DNA-binding NtrC family response regulator
VDDQPAVSTYLQTILRQAGYVVSVFNDPRLALDVLRAEPLMTDLLITDQNMPALTGNAIIQAMRQVRPALPIIVCTGYSAQDPVLMTPGGAISVLQKPFEPARLLASISQVLGQPLPA